MTVSATIRKAAILIHSLDTRSADALLDRMPPDQAAQVRQAIMELDDISEGEQEEIIREFVHGGAQPVRANDGIELDPSLARKLAGKPTYEPAPRETLSIPPTRFEMLSRASASALVRQLEHQHPQVIAVVVAHLPPQHAAEIVKRLPAKLQSDILRRVAELDQTEPDVVREIELELEQRLSVEIQASENRKAGISNVAAILQAAGSECDGLINNLASHEQELADLLRKHLPPAEAPVVRIDATPQTRSGTSNERDARLNDLVVSRKHFDDDQPALSAPARNRRTVDREAPRGMPPFSFEDLARLHDEDWAKVIHAVEPGVMLLALAGASRKFLDRITSKLPPQESQGLNRRLEQTGPIQLADIDRAQGRVVEAARKLAAQGAVRLPSKRPFAAAA